MAIASTRTKLPLATFFKILGMHPLHVSQVRLDNVPYCGSILFQYAWQNADHVSREEIAQAIAEAESKMENFLGYRLAPSWEIDEWHGTHRPFRQEFVNYNSADIRGFNQNIRANWGYMISGGREAKTLIDDNVSIAYTDVDGDGYFETATVTVATVVQDKNEVAVFYPDKDGDDTWEIRPIKVSIASGIATITFRRELAVNPDLFEVFNTEGAEAIGTNDADFLTEVDVYRRYNDPQTQASFLWEPSASGFCETCNGDGCASCSYTTQTGCLLLRGDPRSSIVVYKPADWNSDTLAFDNASWAQGRQPDITRLYYYAGWRDKSQAYVSHMAEEWQRCVAYMAAAMLDRPPCDCNADTWQHWREDLTLISGNADEKGFYREPGSGKFAGVGVTDNPMGSRRGEIFAWRKVMRMGKSEAVVL